MNTFGFNQNIPGTGLIVVWRNDHIATINSRIGGNTQFTIHKNPDGSEYIEYYGQLIHA